MALPILAVATAVKILGPAAAKAAKLAYKMYKKRGGKKTENKFLSDKANKVKKNKDEVKKGEDALERADDDYKMGGGDGTYGAFDPVVKQTRLMKKTGDIAKYNRMANRYNKGKLGK